MIYLFQPTINAISAAAAAAAATSAGLADRGSSVVSITGMVRFIIIVGPILLQTMFVLSLCILLYI